MTDSKDELRKRFNEKRGREDTQDDGDTGDTSAAGSTEDTGNTGDTDTAEDTENGYDWGNKYNYPFYIPPAFAEELDQLYNQYDGKNKVAGGDGLEKHREFLFPIMQAAIEELDLDEVVDWEVDDE